MGPWVRRWTRGCTCGQTDAWVLHGLGHACVYAWVRGRTEVLVDRCMDG